MERFVPADRNQLLLLPPSLNEWVGEDHLVHFIIESVESMELPALHVNSRGTGSAQYSPKMMLELLIYCYSQGIFSSRKIEMATWGDIYVRFIAANTHPDHDTIAKFRKDNFEAIATCFVEVLKLAKEMKLLKVGTVSVDGTKMKASASKDKNVRYDRAVQLEEQLESDVRSRLHKAETADNMNLDDGRLPKELSRLSVLREKMKAARAELEARAKAREEKRQKELAARKTAMGSKDDEEPPKPPAVQARDDEQCNLTDKDSRIMRPSMREAFLQGYNAQACVDAEGSQLILGQRISQCSSDAHELMPTLGTVPTEVGRVEKVLADKGYASRETMEALEVQGIDGYISVQSEESMQTRTYEFRPPRTKAPLRKPTSPWNVRMAEKLKTESGRRLYRLRKQTVEPVFGIIKQAMGFRQFLLRGVENVAGEWRLVCLAYNFRRLYTLSRA